MSKVSNFKRAFWVNTETGWNGPFYTGKDALLYAENRGVSFDICWTPGNNPMSTHVMDVHPWLLITPEAEAIIYELDDE